MRPSASIPLWIKTTLVITIGITLSVWFTIESTRYLDEEYLKREIHDGAQRSTDLLAGLLAEALVTRDTNMANAIISRYVSDWPDITYLHVTDDRAKVFLEWQKKPITFGEGILKFETPVVYGDQNFGILSIYIDLSRPLAAIDEHIRSVEHRVALTLLAMTLFLCAVVNYSARDPEKTGAGC